jgi:hypothetical protein
MALQVKRFLFSSAMLVVASTIPHSNWQMPTLNILSGAAQPGMPATAADQNLGVVSGTAGSMRQIQLGLKYSF